MVSNWLRQTEQLAVVLQRLGECLHIPMEVAEIHQILRALEDSSQPQAADEIGMLSLAGAQLGVRLAASDLSPRDAWTLVADGFAVLVNLEQNGWLLLKHKTAWRIEAVLLKPRGDTLDTEPVQLSLSQVKRYWNGKTMLALLAQSSTAGLSSASSGIHGSRADAHAAGHHGHHEHIRPLKRLGRMLRLEIRDIGTLTLFALVAGVLGLATPLAVESLVNTVAWGTYLQPLFILSLLLFGFLGFAGLLKLLQVIIVEILQRRLFVRIVGDLSNRFPLASRGALKGEHPPEIANRYFDIMTIQKATATLVLDGISIVLQTAIGLVLLAFYHPFLLGFDIVLLVMMTLFTYLLGRGGVRSAIEESKIKYEIAHWLQDVISSPTAFRMHGGWEYAADRANRLTVRYLDDRQQHFKVLVRQVAFSLILLALASTALLGIGGWLVIRGELTLGQLVASELVVSAIVGAFAKIGKSLESYYDLMAAVDKVGHMLDLPFDPPAMDVNAEGAPPRIRWQNLHVSAPGAEASAVNVIEPGARVAVVGAGGTGKSRFIDVLCGLDSPDNGFAEIAGIDCREASRVADGRLLGLARHPEIFCGSLLENVRLGRNWLTVSDVRRALEQVHLWEEVLNLPSGVDTVLQTGGYPLTYSQAVRLSLARALAALPAVLMVDGALDLLDVELRMRLWQSLKENKDIQTILVVTHDSAIIAQCDSVLESTHAPEDSHAHSSHRHDGHSPRDRK